MSIEINRDVAIRVLQTVDAGLSHGIGKPTPGEMCVEAAVCYALGLPHGDDPGCVAQPLRSLKIRLNDANWSSKEARGNGLRRLALAQLGSAGVLDEKEFVRRVVDFALRVSVPQAMRIAAAVIKDPHKTAMIEAAARCENDGTRQAAVEGKNAAIDAAAAYITTAAAYTTAYAAYAAAAEADAAADGELDAAEAAAGAAAEAAVKAAYAAYAAAAADKAAAYAARDKSLSDCAEAVVQILIEMKAPGCQWLPLTEMQS